MRITIEDAAKRLLAGEVVAVPTETVYGLAASLHHPEAIERIFTIKKRPSNNPLIIHLSDLDQLEFFSKVTEDVRYLAEYFWPGPLTIVLETDVLKIPATVRAGLSTAAFRIPKNPLTRKLLEKTGPLVMPSANLSGKPSSTIPEHVEMDFGIDFPILDGGGCQHGLESTIVIQKDGKWSIIRLGAISPDDFEACLDYQPEIACLSNIENPLCPGQLYRHYAPKAHLILTKEAEKSKKIVLGFEERVYPNAKRILLLGKLSDVRQVAENLYAVLRQIDELNVSEAVVDINCPTTGLWLTILERLKKAAAKS